MEVEKSVCCTPSQGEMRARCVTVRDRAEQAVADRAALDAREFDVAQLRELGERRIDKVIGARHFRTCVWCDKRATKTTKKRSEQKSKNRRKRRDYMTIGAALV